MKTIEERRTILHEEIFRLIQQGWKVKNQTDTTCELTKDPPGCAFFFHLIPFVGWTDEGVILNIEVNPEGVVKHN